MIVRVLDLVGRAGYWASRRASRAPRQAYGYLVRERRGRGNPKSVEKWDAQYRSGFWDRLDSSHEVSRYMVVLGYVSLFQGPPSILDVGCGNGRLARLLLDHSLGFDDYVGIDLSAQAISAIDCDAGHSMSFEVADFDDWRTERRFDVIVFNEALYYARFPEKTFARYLPLLSANGGVVVSMCRSRGHQLMWRKLEELTNFVAWTSLETESGTVSDVRMGFPRSPTGSS